MLQINNLIDTKGIADYKTLNIEQIIVGTQLYDLKNNKAYFGYEGDFISHPDILKISVEEYESIKNSLNKISGLSIEERLTLAEQTINDILLGGI